ncbi:MAG: hypothetical protein PVG90_00180 [Bacillota bacterium]|jgi:hypothetical protein
MEFIQRKELVTEELPGRKIQKAVGKASAVSSRQMTVGFATYSAESGPMEPHHHAEETVVVIDCEKGWVRWGASKDNLTGRRRLQKEDIMHFNELEWHVFEYETGGFIDIIFIYGQVDNIRPEEIISQK